jgi:U3 small nucleolar ribonucleoprotein component
MGSQSWSQKILICGSQDPESKEWKGVFPQWQRNQNQPSSITRDMQITIENILTFSEDVLVHCLRKAGSMVPVVIYEIQKENRDSDCPIRLGVSSDKEKLKSQQGG